VEQREERSSGLAGARWKSRDKESVGFLLCIFCHFWAGARPQPNQTCSLDLTGSHDFWELGILSGMAGTLKIIYYCLQCTEGLSQAGQMGFLPILKYPQGEALNPSWVSGSSAA
jgi:hypothetical protein